MTAERDLRARLDAQAHAEDDARARRVTELAQPAGLVVTGRHVDGGTL
ncbi:hypothetical protein [Nocardia sp. NRRL S-836]|nr:hypothetical protein [Nocardia sp. NRRL S-836]